MDHQGGKKSGGGGGKKEELPPYESISLTTSTTSDVVFRAIPHNFIEGGVVTNKPGSRSEAVYRSIKVDSIGAAKMVGVNRAGSSKATVTKKGGDVGSMMKQLQVSSNGAGRPNEYRCVLYPVHAVRTIGVSDLSTLVNQINAGLSNYLLVNFDYNPREFKWYSLNNEKKVALALTLYSIEAREGPGHYLLSLSYNKKNKDNRKRGMNALDCVKKQLISKDLYFNGDDVNYFNREKSFNKLPKNYYGDTTKITKSPLLTEMLQSIFIDIRRRAECLDEKA